MGLPSPFALYSSFANHSLVLLCRTESNGISECLRKRHVTATVPRVVTQNCDIQPFLFACPQIYFLFKSIPLKLLVHNSSYNFLRTTLILSSHLRQALIFGVVPSDLLACTSIFIVRAVRPAHLTFVDLIFRGTISEKITSLFSFWGQFI